MIAADWRVARMALQVIAEQGPGLAMAMEGQSEEAQYLASIKALTGG